MLLLLQDSSAGSPSLSSSNGDAIEPLTGLETILEELLKEDGYRTKFLLNITVLIVSLHCICLLDDKCDNDHL